MSKDFKIKKRDNILDILALEMDEFGPKRVRFEDDFLGFWGEGEENKFSLNQSKSHNIIPLWYELG